MTVRPPTPGVGAWQQDGVWRMHRRWPPVVTGHRYRGPDTPACERAHTVAKRNRSCLKRSWMEAALPTRVPATAFVPDVAALAAAEAALAFHLGPIARVLVRKEAAPAGSAPDLIERLAVHVEAGGRRRAVPPRGAGRAGWRLIPMAGSPARRGTAGNG